MERTSKRKTTWFRENLAVDNRERRLRQLACIKTEPFCWLVVKNESGSWAYYACGSSDDGDGRKSSEEEGVGPEAQLRKRKCVEVTAERESVCVDIKGERGRSVSGTGFIV
ncbi:hypothetical protein PS1_044000 [Malus domestica]